MIYNTYMYVYIYIYIYTHVYIYVYYYRIIYPSVQTGGRVLGTPEAPSEASALERLDTGQTLLLERYKKK